MAAAGLLAATAPVTIPLAKFAGPHIYRGYKERILSRYRAKKAHFKNQYQNIKHNLKTTRNQLGNIKNHFKSNLKKKKILNQPNV